MKFHLGILVACGLLAGLAACGPQRQPQQPTENVQSPVVPAPSAPPLISNREVPAPGTGPNARTPFAPVKPTIDPKSNQAAEELVRGFTRLLNGGRFDEAYMLLGLNAPPRSEFDRHFATIRHLRATAGAAGGQEGAAGSIYLSIPLTISGEVNGSRVTRSATAILRRVNNVPGSTEAQRRWHIERIDWSND